MWAQAKDGRDKKHSALEHKIIEYIGKRGDKSKFNNTQNLLCLY